MLRSAKALFFFSNILQEMWLELFAGSVCGSIHELVTMDLHDHVREAVLLPYLALIVR